MSRRFLTARNALTGACYGPSAVLCSDVAFVVLYRSGLSSAICLRNMSEKVDPSFGHHVMSRYCQILASSESSKETV